MGDHGGGEEAYACVCVTLYNFQGQNDQELSFSKGEYVKVARKGGSWWGGVSSRDGSCGYFPSNYVSDVRDAQEVKKLMGLYPSLSGRWEAPVAPTDRVVSTTAGVVFNKPKDGAKTYTFKEKANMESGSHTLGAPQEGRFPCSQSYACSCGAQLLSLEVAQMHVKVFNAHERS